MRRWRHAIAIALLALLAIVPTANAQQLIERHTPPDPERFRGGVSVAEPDFGRGDPTPLGVDLSGIRLIGLGETAGDQPMQGVSVGNVENAPVAQLQAALAPFIGRPLSLALITEIQGVIAKAWRNAGYPFVSVTVPPQEITSGVLALRVIEARLGDVTVEGDNARGDRLVSAIRARKGDRINTGQLEEDLAWLNRNSHRRIEAVFAAGDAEGRSDLVLKVTRDKPWQIYAGWSNTGSAATGRDRYFAGIGALVPALNDLTFSYQLTGSSDLWADPGRIFPRSGSFPSYVGHSARIELPTVGRQALEISPSLVFSRSEPNLFTAFENVTLELPILYRFAASEVLPVNNAGDFFIGAEYKRLWRTTFFTGIPVASGNVALFHLVAGWQRAFSHGFGRGSLDVRITANPGGVVFGNNSAAWATYSSGRVATVRYAYLGVDLSHMARLPLGLAWTTQLNATVATAPLPDTERLQLGGLSAARAYQVDDGSVDTGLVWRNELRLASFAVMGRSGIVDDRLNPYAFFDLGYGRDNFTGMTSTLAGVGLGLDYSVGEHFSATLAGGFALTDAALTRAGDFTLHARVVGRY